MSAMQDLIQSYVAGSKTLRDAVAGMSAEQLRARPIAGKWSTLEVIVHLADFEPIMADRMKRVIAEDRPTLIGADENRFATALAYDKRDAEEELRLIEVTRSQLARILATLPDSALQRVGVHNERGEMTLQKLLTLATAHIDNHVKFIHEKRQTLGLK
jgi:uncharacterized damage-inducible protein DinB